MDMKEYIAKNHEAFELKIEKLLQYSSEIIYKVPRTVKINQEEKRLILEALILRACAFWESFLGEEVIFCALLDDTYFKKEFGLSHNMRLNDELVRAIIFSDKYRDLHDLERSKGFLRKILSPTNNPVPHVSNEQIRKINFVYTIRNYLSHYSSFSRKILMESYKDIYALSRFQEPGVFLSNANGERFSKLLTCFKMTSVNMRKILR
jgi:hypothetical protein